MTNPENETKTTSPAIIEGDGEWGYQVHHLDFWGIGKRSEYVATLRDDPLSVGQALDNAIMLFMPIITEFVGSMDMLVLSSSARTMFNRIYGAHTRIESRIIHDESRTKGVRSLAFEVDDDFNSRSSIGYKKLNHVELKVIPSEMVERTAAICEATGLTIRCFERGECESMVVTGQRTDVASKRWLMLEFSFAKIGKHSFRVSNR